MSHSTDVDLEAYSGSFVTARRPTESVFGLSIQGSLHDREFGRESETSRHF